MRTLLVTLSLLTLSGTTVDQGFPGTNPWPVTPVVVNFPDGGSSGNVNPAAQTSGLTGQVLCSCNTPTLIDGAPRRFIEMSNQLTGHTVWIGNTSSMAIPITAQPVASGGVLSVDAASAIAYYCLDPLAPFGTVTLPDAGVADAGCFELDGGGLSFHTVL